MKRTWMRIAAGCLLLPLALSGCASVKSAVRKVTHGSPEIARRSDPGPPGMVRRVAVIGLAPAAGLPAGYGALFQSALSAALDRECRDVRSDPAAAERLQSPPRTAGGLIDGHALALLGRRQGVGFFAFGSLSDIRFRDEKTGFWLWKDTRYFVRVAVRVELFDTESAAKILDEIFFEELPLEETAYQEMLQAPGRMDLSAFQAQLAAIHRRAAQRLCALLREQPWTGFVVAAEGARLTISSGTLSGLAPGRVLEVFAPGTVLENKEGLRYFLPGAKIGEAEIVSAAGEQAEARLREAADAAAVGATVRVKR